MDYPEDYNKGKYNKGKYNKGTDNNKEYKERVIPKKINSFDQFSEVYCPPIFLALSRLTGLSDEEELENLTVNVLVDLWEEKDEFYHTSQPGTFLYKMILNQVVLHLEKQGNTDRLSILQDILPIDPGFYLDTPKITRISFAKLTFLQKMKRAWRTF